jgi:mono/diheme cytochrome c family protein
MNTPVSPLVFSVLLAAAAAQAAPVDFIKDVRPIFEEHCYSCHGAEKQKGGLRLDVKSAALKGGDEHAPNILPGKAATSPLITFIKGEDEDMLMPPKGKRLSAAQVETLSRWIQEGALWPDGVDSVSLRDPKAHWSFQPVSDPKVPEPGNQAWPRSPLDRFILGRLEKEGLSPNPEASRSEWLRRVSFDLTGLPPSPKQRQAFEADPRPDAYERVVDELLGSPRYGEQWAQHWLDLVRYADTHGFEVNTERPNAWPYRDHVIRAFNADTPYDQFIREQIAGDTTGQDAATGFLVTASVLLPGQIGADDASKRLARQDSIDEIVVNTSQTFLGLSVGCARCHNHKFDPITARDYYAMQAFFSGVHYSDRPFHSPEGVAAKAKAAEAQKEIAALVIKRRNSQPIAQSGEARPPITAKINIDRFAPVRAKQLRFTVEETGNLEPCIDELEVFNSAGVNVALATAGAQPSASGQTIVADRHDLRFLNDGKYGNSRSWLGNEKGRGWVAVEFPEEQSIETVVWSRDRNGKAADRLTTRYIVEVADASGQWRRVADSSDRAPADTAKTAQKTAPTAAQKEFDRISGMIRNTEAYIQALAAAQRVFAGSFGAPEVIRVLSRGNPEQPKEEVGPAVPAVFGGPQLGGELKEQERRLALANWIADPKNPMTARVMVNRIWQWHFGTGIVDTPSDFGLMGTKPSHPELLDWLAGEFVRGGWSMKKLHKLIVLSSTYRQSSRHNAAGAAKDAEARLLWRFPPRRIEAENLRDTLLAVNGQLNLEMFGSGFNLFDRRGGLSGFKPVEVFNPKGLKRMIYAHKVRREPDAVFGAFDCPDAGLSTSRRRESTTPIQALNLLNSRFALDMAAALAARLKKDVGDEPARQVSQAYELALGRPALPAEMADAVPVVEKHGAAAFCRALLNSNEFLFLP